MCVHLTIDTLLSDTYLLSVCHLVSFVGHDRDYGLRSILDTTEHLQPDLAHFAVHWKVGTLYMNEKSHRSTLVLN